MKRYIDETYLSVHPRTALWWQEREQCRACLHSHEDGDNSQGLRKAGSRSQRESAVGMRCAVSRRWIGERPVGRVIEVYCMDARDEGQKCGPDALLFKSMHKVAA